MVLASDAFVVDGRYAVAEVLGRGGMGEVRRARDLLLDRDVAIKFLRADLAAQPDARQRFEDEAHNAARLSHPNVVQVFATGEHEGQPYLVMECLPGHTLRDETREEPLNQARAGWIARDVLAGLTAAHAIGVVHRDVTPANILLTDAGRAKLADFGISKAAEADSVTTIGQVVGTPAYMAPERLRGEAATSASDIYGLGVTLNTAIGAGRADLDRDFAVLVDRMMDPDPQRRPTAAEALAGLDGTGGVEPVTTTVPVVALAEPTIVASVLEPERHVWRDRGLRIATVAIAAVIGLLLVFASNTKAPSPAVSSEETPRSTVTVPPPTTIAAPLPTARARVEVPAKEPKPKGKGRHGDG